LEASHWLYEVLMVAVPRKPFITDTIPTGSMETDCAEMLYPPYFPMDGPLPMPLNPLAQVWPVADSVAMTMPLAAVEPDPQVLSPAEQAQANDIRHKRRQQTFLAGRTLLRQWLSQVTGYPANRLTLGTGFHGKPFLVEDPSLQFNLSHGGDWLALVLSHRQAVGIDIEPIQPRRQLPQLCRRCLSEAESATVLSLPMDQASVQFLRYWTCKEAYVKGLGVGLTIPLNTVDLTLSSDRQPTEPQLIPSALGLEPGWQIYPWQPTAGYVAALALKG
jgi:4'-phosphopantetheinyl transferase